VRKWAFAHPDADLLLEIVLSIKFVDVCTLSRVTRRVKKPRAGTGMGKNSNPHAGMGFLRVEVRVGGCGYGTALPDGFLPVALSNGEGA
jgi:hypothetical protein